jgi:hypothetical protein
MAQLTNTLSNFITRTRRYLQEPDATNSRWTDDFLKQLFNSNYRRRVAQLEMAHEGYFTFIGFTDLTANTERYAWPVGFDRLLKMELVRSDGRTVPIQRNERHYFVNQTPSSSGDEFFPTYRPVGSGFVLEPAPTESVAQGLKLEWTGEPVELTADSDSLHSDFPRKFDELLVIDTAVAAMDAEGVQESGQMRTLLRQRQEWELDWERFIDSRMTASQSITPFVAHYHDA